MTSVEIKAATFTTIIKCIVYLSLFLIGTEFFLYQAVLLLLLCTLFICYAKRKFCINGTVLLLFLFSLCDYLVTPSNSISGIIHRFAICLIFFSALQMGSNDEPIVELTGAIYSLGSGFLFHLILAVINNLITGYIFTNAYLIDPVTNEALSPTHYSTMFYFALAISFAWLVGGEKEKAWQIFYSAITAALGIICIIFLGRRLVIIAILVLLLFGIYVKFRAGKIRKESIAKLLIVLFLALSVIFVFYDNIAQMIDRSFLVSRFKFADVFDSGRLVVVKNYLSHFFEHMTGGGHFNEKFGYAHNFWLDIYDQSGVLALLFIFAFTVGTIIILIKGIKKDILTEWERILVSMIYIVSYLQFFSEPAYVGTINFVWAFTFITGLVFAKIKSYKRLVLRR